METNEELKPKRWTLPVNEDGILVLPDELWDELDWKENDVLELVDQEDGSFLIIKVEEKESDK